MANSTFKKTLSLMAYENNLTPDIPDDYTLRVKTQAKSLSVEDIARGSGTTTRQVSTGRNHAAD